MMRVMITPVSMRSVHILLCVLLSGLVSGGIIPLNSTRPPDPWMFEDSFIGGSTRATFEDYRTTWSPYNQVKALLHECRGRYNTDVALDPRRMEETFLCEMPRFNSMLNILPTRRTPYAYTPYQPIAQIFSALDSFVELWRDMDYVPTVDMRVKFMLDWPGSVEPQQPYHWRGSLVHQMFTTNSSMPSANSSNVEEIT